MKKIFSVILSLVLIAACVTGAGIISAEDGVNPDGDTLVFGSYPQSRVSDAETLASLNALLNDDSWTSYGYYTGDGLNSVNGSMHATDFMYYADVESGGEKYRAVKFDSYRPRETYNPAGAEDNMQHLNGYEPGNVYWFKYEPISWTVLDPVSGLVICSTVIDSQPFSNYIIKVDEGKFGEYYNESGKYAHNWETSSLRAWLNEDFYSTAFSADEQAKIFDSVNEDLTFDHVIYGNTDYDIYNGESTTDKVFVLSVDQLPVDVTLSGPNDKKLLPRRGTDYAKSQGLFTYMDTSSEYYGNAFWWLRGQCGNISGSVSYVSQAGGSFRCYSGVTYTSHGVCPALRINMHKLIPVPAKEPSCSEEGNNIYYACLHCTKFFKDESAKTETTPEAEAISKTPHSPVTVEGKEATCTQTGLTDGAYCEICGGTLKAQETVPVKDHIDADNSGFCDECNTKMTGGDHCPYCGQIHSGFFGIFVKIFHLILNAFSR